MRVIGTPRGQDVVVTITSSRDPVLRGEWLAPGALVFAAGANVASRRELDNAVLERASFVCCDSLETARLESGDLIEPVQAGVLDWLEVHELHEVVSGEVAGRQSDRDIVVFKSNGLAAWDVAIGAEALRLARASGASGTSCRRSLSKATEALASSIVVARDRADDLGPVEQAPLLLGGEPVLDVLVLEDLVERAAAVVLADHVACDVLFGRASGRGTRRDS